MNGNRRLALAAGVVLVMLAAAVGTGCGQKGPLYLPAPSRESLPAR